MNLADRTIPTSSSKLIRLAIELYDRGEFLAAIDGLRQLVAENEDLASAHFVLAMALQHDAREHAECYDHFERALAIAPGWFDALYNYGRALLRSSREREAEKTLREALAQQPDHPGVQEWLAMTLIEQTRFEEALPYLERVAEMAPDNEEIREERDRIRTAIKESTRLRKIARYPRSTSAFDNVRKIIDDYVLTELRGISPFLHDHSAVFTMGSCFASNIAVALRGFGLIARDLSQAEEINNTYANRYLVEWIAYGESEQTLGFRAAFGEEYRERLAKLLRTSDVFILSLGVAPCFFDRFSGAFVPTHGMNFNTSFLIKEYEFRTTSVGENVANLRRMIDVIKEINPKIIVVLTVSPVPLKATFERDSAIVADCISKSTLRVAAHEYLTSGEASGVIYWPSFEIFRWLGGHVGRVFGTDDGSPFHPDQSMIKLIMSKFVETFGDERLRLRMPT